MKSEDCQIILGHDVRKLGHRSYSRTMSLTELESSEVTSSESKSISTHPSKNPSNLKDLDWAGTH